MKRFLKHIILLLIITSIVVIGLKYITRNNCTKNYDSAFIDKLKTLKKYKDTRKIVLLGGSGTGWGISAAQIESQTGIKTINLGHHASLGLIDYQDFVLSQLTPDDIIVFSPEWEFFINPYFYDKGHLDELITNNREYAELMGRPSYALRFYLIHEIHFQKSVSVTPNNPYRYDCCNINGDIISHCNQPPGVVIPDSLDDLRFNIDSFRAAFKFLNTHKTIIVFPPTQQTTYQKYKPKLDSFERQIYTYKLPILDSIKYNVYPQADFFNAVYHLNCDTRTIRTDKIIPAIKALLAATNH